MTHSHPIRQWFSAFALLAAVLMNPGHARADSMHDDLEHDLDKYRKAGAIVHNITPIFSQLLYTAVPDGFHLVKERPTATQYEQLYVPSGETMENWTQQISISGYKGMADRPGITPEGFARGMAALFSKACPGSFNAGKLDGGPGADIEFLAILSCGISPASAGKTSETTLAIVIKGTHEMYTIQWAERGQPSTQPLPIDGAKWSDRVGQLSPIKLCPMVPGEGLPYASCVEGK